MAKTTSPAWKRSNLRDLRHAKIKSLATDGIFATNAARLVVSEKIKASTGKTIEIDGDGVASNNYCTYASDVCKLRYIL